MKTKWLVIAGALLTANFYAQDINSAIKKTDNEMYMQADAEFRQLLQKNPENSFTYLMLGDNFYAREMSDSALVNWKKASTKEINTYFAAIAAGKFAWMSNDKSAANEHFLKATTMTKNKNAEVLRLIAKTYITAENKNLDEAIVLLEKAIKLDPNNEDGYLLYGDALLYKSNDNASAAIKQYNRVLEINPKSARGLVRVGKLYYRVQNFEAGNEKYQEAQKIDPTYAPAYRENAELWMKLQKPKKAIEYWKKYLELNNSIDARYRYVTAMFLGKQYCDMIPEALALQTDGFNNYFMERMLTYSYAECTTETDAAKKGLEKSDAFFAIAPKDKIIYLDYKYRGLLFTQTANDSLAILEYEKAAAIDEEAKKEVVLTLAKLYLKGKKYDKAIEMYEYKQVNGGLTAPENYDLGKAYYVGPKNFALADSAFAKLNNLSPTYAPGYLWRARTNFQLDPKNEKWLALPHYQKVIELVKVEERAQGGNKAMVIEAAKYLGEYYTKSPAKDIVKAKEFYTIVKELDPADKQAADFFAKNK